ncbi:hypothetical protein FA95DRAFT_872237 [Auriscalpium vulgare]|uniref:Uncharacterized protein n=1 Tax=Auriscalpium vulgare TaxID=40419 RepID=A0ACB8RYP8_9AGAM|nr:hypothetical protein FA95DRAFT_872237 [Auriscalpium vulgare]
MLISAILSILALFPCVRVADHNARSRPMRALLGSDLSMWAVHNVEQGQINDPTLLTRGQEACEEADVESERRERLERSALRLRWERPRCAFPSSFRVTSDVVPKLFTRPSRLLSRTVAAQAGFCFVQARSDRNAVTQLIAEDWTSFSTRPATPWLPFDINRAPAASCAGYRVPQQARLWCLWAFSFEF